MSHVISLNMYIYSFVKQVASKIEELVEEYEKMKDAYNEVCNMFSESPKEEPAVFFGYFRSFISSWKVRVCRYCD